MLKKFTVIILIISTILIISPKPTHAGAWGEDLLAANWKQMMETMYKQIEQSTVASLKMAAIRIIQTRLRQLFSSMSGGKSQAGVTGAIISSWEQFIFTNASNYANKIANDFFTDFGSMASSYTKRYVITPAKIAVDSRFPSSPDIQNYVREGRTDKMFDPNYSMNPWHTWMKAAERQNDMASIYMEAQSKKLAAEMRKQKAQELEGLSGQGRASTKKEDATGETKITVPGSDKYVLEFKALGMSFDMVAMARSVQEVVASMVTQIITQTIQMGINDVASKLSGEKTSSTGYSQYLSNAGSQLILGTNSAIQSAIQSGIKY